MSLAREQRQFIAELFDVSKDGRSVLSEFYRQRATSRLCEILTPVYGEILSSYRRSAALAELDVYTRFLAEDPPRSMDPIEIVSRFLAWFATSSCVDIDMNTLERMTVLGCEFRVENAPDSDWQILEARDVQASSLDGMDVALPPWVSKLEVLAPVALRGADQSTQAPPCRWCTRDAEGLACWPAISPAADQLLAKLYGLGRLTFAPPAATLRELAEQRFLARLIGQLAAR